MTVEANGMRTENHISISAPAEVIFSLAQNVVRWPEVLAHYRYVDVLEEHAAGQQRLVRMGARRGPIPVRWTAEQVIDPASLTIAYRHVAGFTRGMSVEWRIEPGSCGSAVSIIHELPRPQGLLRLPFATRVAGNVFVEQIARRTLEGIKRHAETQARGTAG